MVFRNVRSSVQFKTPFQMRIVGMASFWPSRPHGEQRNQQRGVWIGRLQTKLSDDVFYSRIFLRSQPFAAFRTEHAVIGDVCSTISAEHVAKPTLEDGKTLMPFPHASR